MTRAEPCSVRQTEKTVGWEAGGFDTGEDEDGGSGVEYGVMLSEKPRREI